MSPIRVLVVDDSSEFLTYCLHLLVEARPEIEIVTWALLGREALAVMPDLEVDVVILDLSMPGMDGLEVMRHIKARPRAPKVLIVSVHEESVLRVAAAALGADGFLAKKDLADELIRSLRRLGRRDEG